MSRWDTLDKAVGEMGTVLVGICEHLLDSEDTAAREMAEQAVSSYRKICDAWTDTALISTMPRQDISRAEALANEILMVATHQPEMGIEAMIAPLEEVSKDGYNSLVLTLKSLTMLVASMSVLELASEEETTMSELAAEAIDIARSFSEDS